MTTTTPDHQRFQDGQTGGSDAGHPWTFWIPFAVTGAALTLVFGALLILSNL